MKRKKNHEEKIIFLIFTIVGLVFIGFSIFIFVNDTTKRTTWIKTDATIVDIQSYGGENYNVYVSYIVDGKEYQSLLEHWNITMKVGKKVDLYYNPENPHDAMGNGRRFMYRLFLILGGISVLVGIIPLTKSFRKKIIYRNLKKLGKRVEAKIDNIELVANYSVNGKHPYRINCSYVNPIDGNVYFFYSEYIWYNINKTIEQKNIQTISVYVDLKKANKYYVAIDEID